MGVVEVLEWGVYAYYIVLRRFLPLLCLSYVWFSFRGSQSSPSRLWVLIVVERRTQSPPLRLASLQLLYIASFRLNPTRRQPRDLFPVSPSLLAYGTHMLYPCIPLFSSGDHHPNSIPTPPTSALRPHSPLFNHVPLNSPLSSSFLAPRSRSSGPIHYFRQP
ncbi:hypothetical protein BJ165DRAFT_122342 [Panaeolus papilionaceus]|nr:hypothetical protein BJ165DRAFT_122342 [Panaeolus papilionaceus]